MPLCPAVVAVIFDATSQKVLLVKRRDVPIWVLPGGGREAQETPEEAILREVKEETGLQVTLIRHAAKYTPINALASETDLFFCRASNQPLALSDETADIRFFLLQDLPSTFFNIHAHWLKETLAQPALILRPLHEVTYTALIRFFLTHPWITLRYAWTRYTC